VFPSRCLRNQRSPPRGNGPPFYMKKDGVPLIGEAFFPVLGVGLLSSDSADFLRHQVLAPSAPRVFSPPLPPPLFFSLKKSAALFFFLRKQRRIPPYSARSGRQLPLPLTEPYLRRSYPQRLRNIWPRYRPLGRVEKNIASLVHFDRRPPSLLKHWSFFRKRNKRSPIFEASPLVYRRNFFATMKLFLRMMSFSKELKRLL